MEHLLGSLSFLTIGFLLGILFTHATPKKPDGAIINHYRQILELLFTIKQNQESMNAQTKALLDDLLAKVTAEGTVIDSAAGLLTDLHDKLTDALNGDDTDLRDSVTNIANLVGQGKDKLAAAVQANTIADPGTSTGGDQTPTPDPNATASGSSSIES